jgi:hypothetical protein
LLSALLFLEDSAPHFSKKMLGCDYTSFLKKEKFRRIQDFCKPEFSSESFQVGKHRMKNPKKT